MNFSVLTPAFRDAFRETINLSYVAFDLAKVTRFVVLLLLHVLSVKMAFSIDSTCEVETVIGDTARLFERGDANELLVQLAGTIM